MPPRRYGGTERVVYHLARALAAAGEQVTVFASGDSRVPGCELIAAAPAALRATVDAGYDPMPYRLRQLGLVADRAGEFDVIHNHHDLAMLPLAKLGATPLLTTLHGRLDLPDLAAAFDAYPEARFVSISDAQRAPLAHLPWIATVHHGMPPEDYPFQPRPGDYLAFIGRIDTDKRPEWAIEIARRAGIPLRMAAKVAPGAGREHYERLVRPHVDGRNVEFLGEIGEHEKVALLAGALGLVFPIDWPEPFGLVMTEALACGTPVLARPRGAAPEILVDGVTGWMHDDLAVLARRARELAALPRAGCRAHFELRFSATRMMEDYRHVYRALRESGARAEPRRAAGDRRHLLHSV